jgi:DNA-binding response OmpR family regulator
VTRIYVVDDDERTSRLFASLLAEDGYDVEVFRDGAEALERFANGTPPDAIITDLVMARVSGLKLLEGARLRWPTVPVIFVTGHPELLAQVGAEFHPSPLVFSKPLIYAEFVVALRSVFEEANSLQRSQG